MLDVNLCWCGNEEENVLRRKNLRKMSSQEEWGEQDWEWGNVSRLETFKNDKTTDKSEDDIVILSFHLSCHDPQLSVTENDDFRREKCTRHLHLFFLSYLKFHLSCLVTIDEMWGERVTHMFVSYFLVILCFCCRSFEVNELFAGAEWYVEKWSSRIQTDCTWVIRCLFILSKYSLFCNTCDRKMRATRGSGCEFVAATRN